jgi:hypothetical protein
MRRCARRRVARRVRWARSPTRAHARHHAIHDLRELHDEQGSTDEEYVEDLARVRPPLAPQPRALAAIAIAIASSLAAAGDRRCSGSSGVVAIARSEPWPRARSSGDPMIHKQHSTLAGDFKRRQAHRTRRRHLDSSAIASLEPEHHGSAVHGRLVVKEATLRLDGGFCSDVTLPVSALQVNATSSGAYHAAGATTARSPLSASSRAASTSPSISRSRPRRTPTSTGRSIWTSRGPAPTRP